MSQEIPNKVRERKPQAQEDWSFIEICSTLRRNVDVEGCRVGNWDLDSLWNVVRYP